jgi:hypothetical protein
VALSFSSHPLSFLDIKIALMSPTVDPNLQQLQEVVPGIGTLNAFP